MPLYPPSPMVCTASQVYAERNPNGLTNAVHKWVFISNLERAWEMADTPSNTLHYYPKSSHALVGQTSDHQLPKCTIDHLY